MKLNFNKYILIFGLLLLIFDNYTIIAYTKIDVNASLNMVEEKIIFTYLAIVDAEKNGVNIEELLSDLNEAGYLFSKAKLAFNQGEDNLSFDLLIQSEERLNGIVSSAESLKKVAIEKNQFEYLINLILPILGSLCIISCSAVIWFLTKKKIRGNNSVKSS